jgi:ABC-type Fe3+/spermidine/putrescine transport system ATPase subunit
MITIENLVKSFDAKQKADAAVFAVNDISLTVQRGQLYTLLGPSGCGKTTTLRSIAGLEDPDSGRIVAADRVLFSSAQRVNVPANRRGLGMVFQSYAIWPHMNVFQNVAFPLTVGRRSQRKSKKQAAELVDRVLAVVQLDHLAARPATDLSGGQQQRLALARALVMEPPVLLLDEPLSNLDAKLRDAMRFELKRLQRDLGITTIYVTHDQIEALALSDVIAVLNGGIVEQVGPPQEIYNSPNSRFVADFIGTSNFIDGVVQSSTGPGLYVIRTGGGLLVGSSGIDLAAGTEVTVSIRPEQIQLAEGASDTTAPGVWTGKVHALMFLGDTVDHRVQVGDVELQVRATASRQLPAGTEVTVTLPTEACSLIV